MYTDGIYNRDRERQITIYIYRYIHMAVLVCSLTWKEELNIGHLAKPVTLAMAWHVTACHCMPWQGLVWNCMPWHAMARQQQSDIARHGMPRHGMACHGMTCCPLPSCAWQMSCNNLCTRLLQRKQTRNGYTYTYIYIY